MSEFDTLRPILRRVGIDGAPLDQALAEIRDSLWLAEHDEHIRREAQIEALREAADAIRNVEECRDKGTCHLADSITLNERARAIEARS